MFANYDLDYVNLAIEEGSIPQPAFECRAAPRVPYPILFHCIPIGFPGEQLRLRFRRQVGGINISRTGLRFLWKGGPPPDRMVVQLPTVDGGTVDLECSLVWSREAGDGRWDLGLEFRGQYPMSRKDEMEAGDQVSLDLAELGVDVDC